MVLDAQRCIETGIYWNCRQEVLIRPGAAAEIYGDAKDEST
jgi:hypothetical protein